MWELYVYCLLAGLFGANGVPHFVRGIMGKKFRTPFGKDSSPTLNVAWGWLNFVAAGILIFYANIHPHLLRALGMVALGALIMGVMLAQAFSQDKAKR